MKNESQRDPASTILLDFVIYTSGFPDITAQENPIFPKTKGMRLNSILRETNYFQNLK